MRKMLLALCAATAIFNAQTVWAANPEKRSVVTKVDGNDITVQCGYLLDTKVPVPKKLETPDYLKGSEYRAVLIPTKKGYTIATGWLLPPLQEGESCPYCKKNHSQTTAVEAPAVSVVMPNNFLHESSYSREKTHQLGVALGHYKAPPEVTTSQSGIYYNGTFHPQPPTTHVNMEKSGDRKLITFSGGRRGASGVQNVGNYTYLRMDGDITVTDNSVHNSNNTTNNTSITVEAPPPAPQHDYCGYRNSQGHYWCSNQRVWYRYYSDWRIRRCGRR